MLTQHRGDQQPVLLGAATQLGRVYGNPQTVRRSQAPRPSGRPCACMQMVEQRMSCTTLHQLLVPRRRPGVRPVGDGVRVREERLAPLIAERAVEGVARSHLVLLRRRVVQVHGDAPVDGVDHAGLQHGEPGAIGAPERLHRPPQHDRAGRVLHGIHPDARAKLTFRH